MAYDLAIVLPTFNESGNVGPMVDRLEKALAGIHFEVIFVDDDSPDGTADVVRRLARDHDNLRVLHRIGRRGLASACIEGILAASAPFVAVMDADLQHDESVLPEMLRRMRGENLDLVVGSRNLAGGSMGEFAHWRVKLSQLGKRLSLMGAEHELSDPMSGSLWCAWPRSSALRTGCRASASKSSLTSCFLRGQAFASVRCRIASACASMAKANST